MMPGGNWIVRVEARGGEEEKPQALKAADVEGYNAMYKEGTEKIAGPESTERQFGYGIGNRRLGY